MRSYDVVDFGAPLRQTEKPTPKPQGSEVLLRTLAAGVCHSDLHIWEGWYDLGGGKKLTVKDRGLVPPLTMGHEIVGEVAALGPEATGVKLGDKRLVHPWIGCGTCATCRRGEEQLCMVPRFLGVQKPGGYADHVLVPHPRYLLDLGKLTPAQAAPFACSGITAYGALKCVGEAVLTEQPILIIGAGALSRAGGPACRAPDGGRRGGSCPRRRPCAWAGGAWAAGPGPGRGRWAGRAGSSPPAPQKTAPPPQGGAPGPRVPPPPPRGGG